MKDWYSSVYKACIFASVVAFIIGFFTESKTALGAYIAGYSVLTLGIMMILIILFNSVLRNTSNGIYLLVDLYDITCEKYYNKYKCCFSIINHKDIIDKLKIIEEEILKKYKTNKTPSYKIYEQIKSGYIKIFSDVGNKQCCSFILKISGIWETQQNYGLTYKFIKIN